MKYILIIIATVTVAVAWTAAASSLSLKGVVGGSSGSCVPPGTVGSEFCKQVDRSTGVCKTPLAPIPGFDFYPQMNVSALFPWAVRSPGVGGECCSVVATTNTNVTVYRAWAAQNASKDEGYSAAYQFGAWWSPSTPTTQNHSTYRIDADVCLEWNEMTLVSQCKLALGTSVAVGPGQSACCPDNVFLEQSPELQIYVSTPPGHDTVQTVFHGCETFMWPSKKK